MVMPCCLNPGNACWQKRQTLYQTVIFVLFAFLLYILSREGLGTNFGLGAQHNQQRFRKTFGYDLEGSWRLNAASRTKFAVFKMALDGSLRFRISQEQFWLFFATQIGQFWHWFGGLDHSLSRLPIMNPPVASKKRIETFLNVFGDPLVNRIRTFNGLGMAPVSDSENGH